MCSLHCNIRRWFDVLLFSDKDDKQQTAPWASSLYWLAGEVKEHTHITQEWGSCCGVTSTHLRDPL